MRPPATGVDIFRIFDALNNVESMRLAIEAVRETGSAVAEVAMSYTGDLSNPAENLYTWTTTCGWPSRSSTPARTCWPSRTWPDCCGHRRPRHWWNRCRFDLPVHVHTHDTRRPAGDLPGGVARPGPVAVDGAAAPMAGTTSQPALSSIVAAAVNTEYDTGLSLGGLRPRTVLGGAAKVYAPFESGLPAPTGRVYTTRSRAGSCQSAPAGHRLGLGDRFEDVENAYAGADRILGRLVKVTPSSKVVGDLALALVGAGVSTDDFAADPARYDIPESVIGFLRGELGDPPGGWPEPLRTKHWRGARSGAPEQPPDADAAA